jgi:hypothetical protein
MTHERMPLLDQFLELPPRKLAEALCGIARALEQYSGTDERARVAIMAVGLAMPIPLFVGGR